MSANVSNSFTFLEHFKNHPKRSLTQLRYYSKVSQWGWFRCSRWRLGRWSRMADSSSSLVMKSHLNLYLLSLWLKWFLYHLSPTSSNFIDHSFDASSLYCSAGFCFIFIDVKQFSWTVFYRYFIFWVLWQELWIFL